LKNCYRLVVEAETDERLPVFLRMPIITIKRMYKNEALNENLGSNPGSGSITTNTC